MSRKMKRTLFFGVVGHLYEDDSREALCGHRGLKEPLPPTALICRRCVTMQTVQINDLASRLREIHRLVLRGRDNA